MHTQQAGNVEVRRRKHFDLSGNLETHERKQWGKKWSAHCEVASWVCYFSAGAAEAIAAHVISNIWVTAGVQSLLWTSCWGLPHDSTRQRSRDDIRWIRPALRNLSGIWEAIAESILATFRLIRDTDRVVLTFLTRHVLDVISASAYSWEAKRSKAIRREVWDKKKEQKKDASQASLS